MIPYEDLLGAPFLLGGRDRATGVDCWWAAMRVAERAGLELPDVEATLLGRALAELREAVGAAAAAAGVERVADHWRDGRPGDTLAFGPQPGEAGCHAAGLLSLRPALCLHAVRGVGVVAVHPGRLTGLLGVWRAPPAAAKMPA